MNLMDISQFEKCKVLVLGDLMIDEYVWGEVGRISPEAPVQVVSVNNEDFTLGGAGNVVNNLVALGATAFPVGVIGEGRNGQRLLSIFEKLGLDTEGIFKEEERPTTRKTRVIAGSQHVLRIDRENCMDISFTTLESITAFIEKKLPKIDIVLISDYGKGLLTPALLGQVFKIARHYRKKTIVDPKGLNYSKYAGAYILTPNRKEAALASGVDIRDSSSVMQAGYKILKALPIENILITCGKDGMVLFEQGAPPRTIRAKARQIYDVSGAGDTVVAVMGLALASGAPLFDASAIANTAAGIVVGKVGTAPVTKKDLSLAMGSFPDETPTKQKSLVEIEKIASELKKQSKRIVFTNGCFDLLHAGHVDFLSASKQMGDLLIVGIDDDASVKELKGPGRPIIAARERVRILNAMDSVDYIVIFASNQLDALIEAIRPDILTKGDNYAPDEVKYSELVEQLGGQVALIPVTEDFSSSQLISDIKNS